MPELSSISVKTATLVTILLAAGFVRTTRGAQGGDCSSKPETGPCRGLFPKFYFDPSDKTCKQFTYGGCDGNANKYDSKEQCQKACGGYGIGDL